MVIPAVISLYTKRLSRHLPEAYLMFSVVLESAVRRLCSQELHIVLVCSWLIKMVGWLGFRLLLWLLTVCIWSDWGMVLFFLCFVFTVSSLCFHCVFTVSSLCFDCAFTVSSLCFHCVFTFSFSILCFHCVFTVSFSILCFHCRSLLQLDRVSGMHTRSIMCKPVRNRDCQTIGK